MKFKGGLQKFIEDERDFSVGAVFGVIENLPKEFIVSGAENLKARNQGRTDYCGAFSGTTCSQVQENVELNPDYQFAKAKQLEGNFKTFGVQPRLLCKSLTKFGSIPQTAFEGVDKSKNLRNWKNWDSYFDLFAKKHKKQSYFRVDKGFGDKFETIKSSLYQHNSLIFTGLVWKPEYMKNSILKRVKGGGEGHAITIIGWKEIDSKEYLILLNSYGEKYGDKGKWYLPKEMINELLFAYIFIDMSKEEAQYMLERNIKINDDWITQFIKSIKYLVK
jgi:hypothetical protein